MDDATVVEKVARAICRVDATQRQTVIPDPFGPKEIQSCIDADWTYWEPEARAAITAFLADLETRGMKIGPATIPEPVAAWEAKAAEFHAANVAEERADPEYKRGDLRESARMLRRWLADAAPANELGQVSFLRALVEAHLAVVDEVIEDQDRAMIAAEGGET